MGRKRTGKGYINLNGGREHQLVTRKAGIIFRLGEVIHHIDGNKRNNSLDNLMVMSIADHIKLHAGTLGKPNSFEYVPVTCPLCYKERRIQYRCTKRYNFTGLCKSCNGKVGGVHNKLRCDIKEVKK